MRRFHPNSVPFIKKKKRRAWLARRHKINDRCCYCKLRTVMAPHRGKLDHFGDTLYATLDHIVPTSKGGADAPDNWDLACQICNRLKDNMSAAEYRKMLKKMLNEGDHNG